MTPGLVWLFGLIPGLGAAADEGDWSAWANSTTAWVAGSGTEKPFPWWQWIGSLALVLTLVWLAGRWFKKHGNPQAAAAAPTEEILLAAQIGTRERLVLRARGDRLDCMVFDQHSVRLMVEVPHVTVVVRSAERPPAMAFQNILQNLWRWPGRKP